MSAVTKIVGSIESDEVGEETDEVEEVGDKPAKPWYCYMLFAVDSVGPEGPRGPTYVGVSVDFAHRLRQHNCEIKGGASATRVVCQAHAKKRGIAIGIEPVWTRAMHVRGFPNSGEALRFEWKWKNLSKSEPRHLPPIIRRFRALHRLLALDKATAKGASYSEYPTPLELVCESPEAITYWSGPRAPTPYFGTDLRICPVI